MTTLEPAEGRLNAMLLGDDISTRFDGLVSVSSSIVDYLSSGLYETPAACLKELINNSYDADATVVNVFVKPDADMIIVDDNGVGFTQDKFETHFQRLSESHKREISDQTLAGRSKIGKIGIGFIAANEVCDIMEIYTTVEGSAQQLHAIVDFSIMRTATQVARRLTPTEPADSAPAADSEPVAVKKGDYVGEILEALPEDHYTRIFLREIRGRARELFVGHERSVTDDAPGQSLYGLTADSVVKRLRTFSTSNRSSWEVFDLYSQTMLEVALNVPVKYADGWLPKKHEPAVRPFVHEVEELNFVVNYDGMDLRKPIVFPLSAEETLVRRIEFSTENVSARGYLYARHGVLVPQELNGVLVRIRNAAVGKFDGRLLDYPSSRNTLFQRWISGEIWASDELEDAMNIDRVTLRPVHDALVDFQRELHRQLDEFFKVVRAELYEKPAQGRRQTSARSEVQRITDVLSSAPTSVRRQVAARINETWERPEEEDARSIRRVLQKYSVADIYEIVLDVADEVLTPAERDAFLDRLTSRLSQ